MTEGQRYDIKVNGRWRRNVRVEVVTTDAIWITSGRAVTGTAAVVKRSAISDVISL
jgi:hypothetical protein